MLHMGFNYISDDNQIVVFGSKLADIYGSPFNIEAMEDQSNMVDEGSPAFCKVLLYQTLRNFHVFSLMRSEYFRETNRSNFICENSNDCNYCFKKSGHRI